MIEVIITGGQTGVDQAGWRAAHRVRIVTSGWMPRDYLTEAGPRPDFARAYGARPLETRSCAARTRRNVADCDAALIYGPLDGRGTELTLELCREMQRPVFLADDRPGRDEHAAADWIVGRPGAGPIQTLLIAGARESAHPGIGKRAEQYFNILFQILKRMHDPALLSHK